MTNVVNASVTSPHVTNRPHSPTSSPVQVANTVPASPDVLSGATAPPPPGGTIENVGINGSDSFAGSVQ